MQPRIQARLVSCLALGSDAEGIVQERNAAPGSLLAVTCLQGIRKVEQCVDATAAGHHEVPEMGTEGSHEMECVEPFGKHLVESPQSRSIISPQEILDKGKTVLIIKDVQVPQHILIFHVGAAESHRLVEDGQRVPHRPVSLLAYYMEGLVVDLNSLLLCDGPQVPHHVGHADAVEVISLATGEDGGEDLMLLSRGKDEYSVCRRLLEGLEEGVEGRSGKHVDLVDYIHAVLPDLGRDLHLVHQGLDVFDSVVGRGVEFVDAIGTALLEGLAGLAMAARLHVLRGIGTIYGLGEYPGGTGLPDAAGAAEKIGVGQLTPQD